MGPEGGDGGGTIVAQGTPEDIARSPESHTGRFLAEVLPRRPVKRAPEAVEAKPAKKGRAKASVSLRSEAAE
jgi:excinuclease ABC subunit A